VAVHRLPGAAILVFALVVACGSQTEPSTSQPPAVVTEHRFSELTASVPSRLPLGADCSRHGAASCSSQLCLHVSHNRNSGFVCSQACRGHEDCPKGWSCAQTHPNPGGSMCIPGKTENHQ
jgi:hypothetical protein